jgi:hypothetical protein
MTKLSAALLLAGIACGIASTATAQTAHTDDDEQACIALILSQDGKFDCIPDGEPTPGKYYFTTWENYGKTIVRGYPWMDSHGQMGRVDSPTDYRMCQDMVDSAWNHPDFEKYDEIWCVKAGE